VQRSTTLIDLHAQLLPGIGNGAPSWDDALQMAAIAEADGIATIVCTVPHTEESSRTKASLIRSRTRELELRLREVGNRIRLLPSSLARIDDTTLQQLHSGALVTLADRGRHLLLELPALTKLPLEKWLAQLKGLGVAGVIAQPERWHAVSGDLRNVERLIAAGGLMLVGSHSLLGHHGLAVKQRALAMLRAGLVHFIASGAASVRSRPPLLSRAAQFVASIDSADTASKIFSQNPTAVLHGQWIETPIARTPPALPFWSSWRRAA
jgi:protein-tyrosine phosphatase